MLVIKLSEMHEVSVTPLSDCTMLTRSTRIRREASALYAAIRNKRVLTYPFEAFSSHAKQPVSAAKRPEPGNKKAGETRRPFFLR